MQGVIRAFVAVVGILWLGLSGPTAAQDQQQVWVQIEARPTLPQALERARAYDNAVRNVTGYRLRTGWYAIALGPYSAPFAEAELARLRAERAIPPDSFIADGGEFVERFWPDQPLVTILPETVTPPPVLADETPAQARAGERALSEDDRIELQRALQWAGYYTSTIDGLIGPGTRRSMAAWQAAEGFDPTGVMTTGQRADLVGAYRTARNSLGIERVVDFEAGIEADLPKALVAFDRYEAPFAHFTPVNDSGAEVLFISQAGDSTAMAALYEILQTLEILPPEGRRVLSRRGFTIEGENDARYGFASVSLTEDTLKGFVLSWPAEDRARRILALGALRDSFTALPGVLPDDIGLTEDQRPDLVAGLQIRAPRLTQSGGYIDAGGGVLTALGQLEGCGRITLGDETEMSLTAADPTLGVALLRPTAPQAPIATLRLAATTARLKSDIAVAGHSYGGILGAPTVTYGTLEDVRGLDGDARRDRLSISVQPGDAGGPVLSPAGALLGVLMPAPADGERTLPADVHLSTDAAALAPFLAENGVPDAASFGAAPIAPEDLATLAADVTVLVQCWD